MIETDDSPKPEKPPYESPLKWQIRNIEEVWKNVKDGTYDDSGARIYRHVGERAVILGNSAPLLMFGNGEMEFRLGVYGRRPQGEIRALNMGMPPSNLGELLKRHVDSSLDVENGVITRKKGTISETETIGKFSEDIPGLTYNPRMTKVESAEKLEEELKLALEIYRIYASELYKLSGLEVPDETIVVDYPKEDLYKNLNKISDFIILRDYLKESKYKEIYLPDESLNKELFLKPFLTPNLGTRGFLRPPDQKAYSPSLPKREDDKKIQEEVKKLGGKKNSDLQTLREAIVIEDRPNVTFDMIGGQPQAVEQARRLARQLANPEAFLKWGVTPPRGILFYGDPGNGKTLIGKALAKEADAAFVMVKASDIASKWYGDAEKLAKGVFAICKEEAAERGHCILFLDEVESIVPARDSARGVHEATGKVIAVMLQEIDGLNTTAGITVIATTNLPESIDRAFLSRMTAWVEVPNPNEDGIAQICKLQLSLAGQRAGRDLIRDGIDYTKIATEINGVSGRDIADIVQIALAKKAEEELSGVVIVRPISEEDIIEAHKISGKNREAKKRSIEVQKRRVGFRTSRDED